MLAAATLGLLPAALEPVSHGAGIVGLTPVLGGFLGGVALLYLLDWVIPHQHAGGHHEHEGSAAPAHEHEAGHEHCHHASVDERARHQGWLVLGAMSLHRLPEGFAIGAAFAADRLERLGFTLVVAIALQNAIEGAVMAAPLKRGGLPAGRLIGLTAMTGLSVPIAAGAGFLLSHQVGSAMPIFLAMAAGALIYLTCNEIIPESHSHKNERQATFGLLAGFVLVMLLQAVGHRDGHAP
jgi:ZIP family zinc transporter